MADDDAKCPPANSPEWNRLTDPLYSFLEERPRSWKELTAWGKKQRMTGIMLRQCLAWLSLNGFAQAVRDDSGSVIWKALR